MRKGYSVWYWPYAKRYYLTHPWKWFRHLRINIRDVYRRAKYGWTYTDVWDMDNWIMNVFPPMLRHMADKGSAYPGREPFDTPEKWHKWLHAMADLIESGLEENQNACNEYYNEFIEHLSDRGDACVPGMDKDYFKRAEEIGEDAEHNLEVAFSQIGKHFYNLWD